MNSFVRTHRNHSRREWLARSFGAFGLLALADLLAAESLLPAAGETDRAARTNTVRPPHHPARAKRVIFLFMPGGPSHVDLLDPKPRLLQDNGKLAFYGTCERNLCVIRATAL